MTGVVSWDDASQQHLRAHGIQTDPISAIWIELATMCQLFSATLSSQILRNACSFVSHALAYPGTSQSYRFVENTPWLNSLQGRFLPRMKLREVLAQNLKAFRQAQGLSQEELAHRAGIDRTYVSSLERCRYGASIDVIERIAEVFGVDPVDLLQKPTT